MANDADRPVGLWLATLVGIGAIVGGGILVLAGVAFANAGPGAIVAFAANGVVALITALSFAEISSAFPQSGGTYAFAKKVLSVRAAFAVGWVLWFAYIVAGVLYAVGFASYAALVLQELWSASGSEVPAWLRSRPLMLLLATLATLVYAGALARKATGGGAWATIGKLVVFFVLIVAGVFGVARQPIAQTTAALSPFLEGSSFYKMPKLLQWFTGNIGLHHIHHVRPLIPNYNLAQCYDEISALQAVEPLTIRRSLKSLRMNLWDEEEQKLVSFRSMKTHPQRSQSIELMTMFVVLEKGASWQRLAAKSKSRMQVFTNNSWTLQTQLSGLTSLGKLLPRIGLSSWSVDTDWPVIYGVYDRQGVRPPG